MKVAFVASNPSRVGSHSPAIKNFKKWIKVLGLFQPVKFFNVSNSVTPNNRPLKKSEYELGRLILDVHGYERVVALGTTASNALEMIGVPHFRFPHPSPKNRVLNDSLHVEAILAECKKFILSI